jgi:DNA-binding LytR/AlgR family response regulator
MTTIRTLVVDDEKLARERLKGFLSAIKDVEVVGEAEDGKETISLVEKEQPDLIFLDVEMPGQNGFSVYKSLEDPPHVIFATAYDSHAIEAFEVDATDYLLKPFSQKRVVAAIDRIRDRLELEAQSPAANSEAPGASRYAAQIPVHTAKKIVILPVEKILWFAVESRLVYAHVNGRSYMTNFTLRDLEERLDPEIFFRAHKSRLVNLRQVKEVTRWFGGRFRLLMADDEGSEVELSRVQARALRARLGW